MNRLTPVLYIRSTLASSKASTIEGSREAGKLLAADRKAEETQGSQDDTLEKPDLPMPASFSESVSIALPVVGEGDPSTPRRARREVASLFASHSVDGPFRSPQSSGETPSRPDYDPLEGAIMERISVGLVPVHMPRLTDPIAPCTGFAMQAEFVKGPNKFNAYRKAQRKAAPERENRVEEPEGGLFFASRIQGRSPSSNASRETSRCLSDSPPPQQPLVDYLRVDIPSVSIVVPGTENSL